jgi:hypothetical protein
VLWTWRRVQLPVIPYPISHPSDHERNATAGSDRLIGYLQGPRKGFSNAASTLALSPPYSDSLLKEDDELDGLWSA